MARLPKPGGDVDEWGTILNDFLSVEHNSDGTLKAASSLASKEPAIAPGSVGQYWRGDKTWQNLDTDSALSSNSDFKIASQKATKAYVDGQVIGSVTPDASASTKGKVQLAGDLGGTANAPLVKSRAVTFTIASAGSVAGSADYICTGTADDVTINAAIAAAGPNAVIEVRPGTYNLTATINNNQDGLLIRGAVIGHYAKPVYWKAAASYTTFAKISAQNPGGFQDIYMDGNSLVMDGLIIGSSSTTSKVKNPRVRNLQIRNFTGRGIGGVGLIPSGSWDDTVFDNVRVTVCGIGVENESTQTTFLGGSLGGNTVALACVASSAANFFGTVFTSNTTDIDIQTTISTASYGFYSTYHESATHSILKRSVVPSGADTVGGFTFVGSNLRNQTGSGYVLDLTNIGATITLVNCTYDVSSGASRTIYVGTNSNVTVNGIGIGNIPLFAGKTSGVSVNTAGSLSVNSSTSANKLNVNAPPTSDSAAEVIIAASAAGSKPLVVQGTSSQSGRLFVAKNVAGGEIMFVSNIGRVFADSGSVATPAYGDAGNTNTGLYFPAANNVGLTVGGVLAFQLSSSSLDVKTRPIINVTDPTNAQDAATKNYVDVSKRSRVATTTPSGNTYTINGDATDLAIFSSPSANFTVAAPSGTPTDGQTLKLRVISGATGYTPTWNTVFVSSGVATLPNSALPAGKTCTFGFVYDANNAKWTLMAADTAGY